MDINELRGKRVGVVFSSGFFGFFGHAGCQKALEELGITPIGYAGTSSGAIMAAFAAAGATSQTIHRFLTGLKKDDFWDPEPWYRTALGVLKLFRGWSGYLEGERFNRLLSENLPVARFEELATPCVIVACNLTRKKKEVFTTGSIAEAVHASGTIPWIFKAKRIGEEFFLDGGLVDKAPVEELVKRVHPEVIIVHYIFSGNLKEGRNMFFSKRFSPHAAYALATNLVRHEHYLAQVAWAQQQGVEVLELTPSLPQVTPHSLETGGDAFAAAYRCAIEILSSRNI